MINPIVIDLFWSSENGGSFSDVVQVVDDTEYLWNCYNCGKVVPLTIMSFLTRMRNTVFECQLNFKDIVCTKKKWFKDSDVLSLIREDTELYEFTKKEFEKSHKELEVISRCPICGKLHSVKLRSIRRNSSFVCTQCNKRYGEKVFLDLGKSMYDLVPSLEKQWGKDNKRSIRDSYPLLARHPYYVVCEMCGKTTYKNLDTIQKTGSLCNSCAAMAGRIRNVGSLRDVYPQVAKMWDEGGNERSSDMLTPSASLEGEFLCRGVDGSMPPHKFHSAISIVIASAKKGNTGCPICANRQVYPGINDFTTVHSKWVSYWDYSANEYPPEATLCTSLAFYNLICPRCGKHIRKRDDAVRRSGAYCPSCARVQTTVAMGHSLRDKYPDVADMYDKSDKNVYSSSDISYSSNDKAYFYCDGFSSGLKPHIFEARVHNMILAYDRGSSSRGCPVCAGFKTVSGVNDFKTMNPSIAELWDYDGNIEKPEQVYYRSENEYKFICPRGHHYTSDPLHLLRSAAIGYTGCPVCKGKEIVPGFNDLFTTHPTRMRDCPYDLNTDLDPHYLSHGSNRIMNARCESCGAVYSCTVWEWLTASVVSCDKCRNRGWSFQEKEIANLLKEKGIRVEENKLFSMKKFKSAEADIYIPSKLVAIEYNGVYWHSDAIASRGRNYHLNKYALFSSHGVKLYAIWSDTYEQRKDLVIEDLLWKLGLAEREFISVAECECYLEDFEDVRSFMQENSLNDITRGSYYMTMRRKRDDLIVALLVLRKDVSGNIVIKDYICRYDIPDWLSHMSGVIFNNFNCSCIGAVVDCATMSEKLFADAGYIQYGTLKPEFSYVYGNKRINASSFKESFLKNNNNLIYEEGKSESELATINNIPRCWDYGKEKWVLRNSL